MILAMIYSADKSTPEIKGVTKYSSDCSLSTWNGSSFTIGVGYTWGDVYPHARSNSLIVVGGGTPVSVFVNLSPRVSGSLDIDCRPPWWLDARWRSRSSW